MLETEKPTKKLRRKEDHKRKTSDINSMDNNSNNDDGRRHEDITNDDDVKLSVHRNKKNDNQKSNMNPLIEHILLRSTVLNQYLTIDSSSSSSITTTDDETKDDTTSDKKSDVAKYHLRDGVEHVNKLIQKNIKSKEIKNDLIYGIIEILSVVDCIVVDAKNELQQQQQQLTNPGAVAVNNKESIDSLTKNDDNNFVRTINDDITLSKDTTMGDIVSTMKQDKSSSKFGRKRSRATKPGAVSVNNNMATVAAGSRGDDTRESRIQRKLDEANEASGPCLFDVASHESSPLPPPQLQSTTKRDNSRTDAATGATEPGAVAVNNNTVTVAAGSRGDDTSESRIQKKLDEANEASGPCLFDVASHEASPLPPPQLQSTSKRDDSRTDAAADTTKPGAVAVNNIATPATAGSRGHDDTRESRIQRKLDEANEASGPCLFSEFDVASHEASPLPPLQLRSTTKRDNSCAADTTEPCASSVDNNVATTSASNRGDDTRESRIQQKFIEMDKQCFVSDEASSTSSSMLSSCSVGNNNTYKDEYCTNNDDGLQYVRAPDSEYQRGTMKNSSSGNIDVDYVDKDDDLATHRDDIKSTQDTIAYELEAVVVDESKQAEEMEKQIRDEISQGFVMPDSVEKVESPRQRRTKRAVFIILAIAAVITIIVLSVKLTNDKDQDEDNVTPAPTLNPNPTLRQITEAGMIKCLIFQEAEVDFCRALAAAVFGREDLEGKLYLINGSSDDSFTALANGTVDIEFSTTYTMERDLYQQDTEVGFTFTVPFAYDGLTFGGVPEFVECADDLNTFHNCSDLKICVAADFADFDFLDMRLPASAIVPVTGSNPFLNIVQGFFEKRCNVIGSLSPFVAEAVVQQFGDTANYTVGNKMHTKQPLSFMTRDNDPEWSDFVNAVVQSLFAPAAINITNDTTTEFRLTSVFGNKYENMFINAIAEVGSLGEIYRRHNIVFRPDINEINTNGSSGLIYSLPFGDTKRDGPGPVPGGTLEDILKRGKLLCGIRLNRPGFAYYNDNEQRYSGLDVDYCHTLASGIFRSNRTAVEFVPFDEDNTIDVFKALENRTLDVAAGIGITLERDVREPSTGEGYSFSAPYFYDPPEGPLEITSSLVTRQDDPQWSAVVYWIVMATFYAEENGLTYDLSYEMPLVNILGPYVPVETDSSNNNNNKARDFTRLFRDAIFVGNYGELYERNVEVHVPRSGRNQLNKDPLGPQLNPFLLF